MQKEIAEVGRRGLAAKGHEAILRNPGLHENHREITDADVRRREADDGHQAVRRKGALQSDILFQRPLVDGHRHPGALSHGDNRLCLQLLRRQDASRGDPGWRCHPGAFNLAYLVTGDFIVLCRSGRNREVQFSARDTPLHETSEVDIRLKEQSRVQLSSQADESGKPGQ
jgi:hypothetical protein